MRLDNCSQFLRDNRCFEIKHIYYIYKKLAALFCLWYGVKSYGFTISFIIVHKPRADIAQHIFLAFWAQLGTLCRTWTLLRGHHELGITHIKTVCTQNALTSEERQKQYHLGDHVEHLRLLGVQYLNGYLANPLTYWSFTSSTNLVGSSVSAEMSVISCSTKSDKV